MIRDPKIPMSPIELPQQRLHEVVNLHLTDIGRDHLLDDVVQEILSPER